MRNFKLTASCGLCNFAHILSFFHFPLFTFFFTRETENERNKRTPGNIALSSKPRFISIWCQIIHSPMMFIINIFIFYHFIQIKSKHFHIIVWGISNFRYFPKESRTLFFVAHSHKVIC